MTSLYVHPRLGEVTLSQTVRARRISISVRATGAVRLSFPCGVPQKRALDFLEQKAEWIGAARERLARKRASLPPQLPPEERKARIGRNPHTKEAIEISATRVPAFKASKALKDNVAK